MSGNRVVRKLPVVAFAFLLSLGMLLPGALLSARAADPAPKPDASNTTDQPNQGGNGQNQGGNGGTSTTKPGDTKPGDTKPGDTKPGDTKPGDTKPGDTKPGDTKPEPKAEAKSEGDSGTCHWKYTTNEKDGYIFTLSAKDGGIGELKDSDWKGGVPPWGAANYKEMRDKITSIVIDGTIKLGKNAAGLFKGFEKVTKIDLTDLDTSDVTDMSEMFSGCKALTDLNAGELDTSNVKNMSQMFAGCKDIKQLNLGGWDTSATTNFKDIFHGCTALKELDISTWSTAKAADGAADIFKGLTRLQKMTISHKFNLKKTGIERLFGKHITWSPESDGSTIFKTAAALKRFHNNKKHLDGAETYLRSNKRGTWKQDADGQIFCIQNGEKLTGWQNLQGTIKDRSSKEDHWFYFDDDGFALTGRQKLFGGYKNDKGETEEHWFCFDENTGAEIRGWAQGEKPGTWYYYGEDGAGLAGGRYEINGGIDGGKHWFCFDKDGLQIRGWNEIGGQWYYYSTEDGAGYIGQHEVDGGKNGGMHWFYFDEKSGAEIRGWKYIDYQDKWCYYNTEDGTMLKGQYELEGGDKGGKHWFYFDEATGAEFRNCWKQIPSQGKTCYYGSDGAMYKGAHSIDGKDYYFDEATGAVQ